MDEPQQKDLKENIQSAYPDPEIKSAVRRKRAKKQGVGGKPTNVKTFAAKGGIISNKSNMGLFGRS